LNEKKEKKMNEKTQNIISSFLSILKVTKKKEKKRTLHQGEEKNNFYCCKHE
jgi:hypothetical protein